VKTILVVDDEDAVLDALSVLLEDEGYRVLTAEDGEAALARIAEERPHVVLLDVMMPKLDGHEVLRAMRATPELARLPVLLMSAAHGSQARVEGVPFLRKPFDIAELLERIQEALSGSNDDGDGVTRS
jgi:DNA-binding response OmpR family regulator